MAVDISFLWQKRLTTLLKFLQFFFVLCFLGYMAVGGAGRPIELFFDNWKTMVPLNFACKRPIRIATRLVITFCCFVYLKISNNGNKGIQKRLKFNRLHSLLKY